MQEKEEADKARAKYPHFGWYNQQFFQVLALTL